VSGDCKCLSNSAPPTPLAGFQGPLRSRGKRGKGELKEGKENEGKGWKKTTPKYKSGYGVGSSTAYARMKMMLRE